MNLDSSLTEASKQTEIDEKYCCKGVNKEDDSVLDSSSVVSKEYQGNEGFCEKGMETGDTAVSDSVQIKGLKDSDASGDWMMVDNSPVETSKQCLLNEEHYDEIPPKAWKPTQTEEIHMISDLEHHETVSCEVSEQQEGNGKDHEKGAEKLGVVVLNKVPVEDLSNPEVYVENMHVDSSPIESSKQLQGMIKECVKRVGKRKRDSLDDNLICRDTESLVTECRRELDTLFEYYKEFSTYKLNLEEVICSSNQSLVACVLEESSLPFSKLVEEVYEKLKGRDGVTLAFVRISVLSVGQRMTYGIASADVDVLEDESSSCLWCWETRDMKLLPKTQRGIFNIRRTGRKKIHERISALSATLSALSVPENQDSYKSDLNKASVMLGKALNGEQIRSFIEKLKSKTEAHMAEKVSKLKEKEVIKEMEKNKRSAEKERKRIERDIQREKWQSEKELKRQQEEAEKEERRREREEAESKKQLKKQREEAEKDQRCREKAEAELKKQLAIQKQATIMERFLKTKKSNEKLDNADKRPFTKDPIADLSHKEEGVNATTLSMDYAFSQPDSLEKEDLRKLHVDGWHKCLHSNRSSCWGVRRNPKVRLFKELKLQVSFPEADPLERVETPNRSDASHKMNTIRVPGLDKLVDGSEECFVNNNLDTALPSVRLSRRKLLQFDKSNRPAYYGTWSKKSGTIGPRHPFRKDPDLDYDVDSDEEWEEEEPGESLSDCDKDAEEDLEDENAKVEDDEGSEDDFVVPDGYLSENEGVQVDGSSDDIEDEAKRSTSCKPEAESMEINTLLQQQRYLQNMTEQALRKSHPLVISNIRHENSEIMMAEDISGTRKVELICLQAVCMRACPGSTVVDIPSGNNQSNEDQEVPTPESKSNSTPAATASAIPDSDLPEFVSSIRSNSHGISKVLESLQQKFPTTSKSQLRNKVREISDFVDNRWQVKKEILNRLGLSGSPEKGFKAKGIAAFFSKRCLPPEGKSIDIASPQPCSNSKALHGDGGRLS